MARLGAVATALVVLLMAAPASAADRYRNPPPAATIPATGDRVETFADPDVIQGRDGA